MARRDDVAAALELMQGGLKFEYDRGGWWWRFREQVSALSYSTEYDAVRDFCQWYAQIRTVKDEPQPATFDVDKFMMDGIQALTLAAAEEMQSRGQEFDAELAAGALARAWHDSYGGTGVLG